MMMCLPPSTLAMTLVQRQPKPPQIPISLEISSNISAPKLDIQETINVKRALCVHKSNRGSSTTLVKLLIKVFNATRTHILEWFYCGRVHRRF